MKTRSPCPHRQSPPASQHGFGLMELLLVAGAMTVLSSAIYLALGSTSTASKVRVEQAHLGDLSRSVDTSYGLLGTFEGVTTADLIRDHLAPETMTHGGTLESVWGGAVTVRDYNVRAPGDAFKIIYQDTPAAVCAPLISSVADSFWTVLVNGYPVIDHGALDLTAVASACGQTRTSLVEFIAYSGRVYGTAPLAVWPLFPSPASSITPPPSSPPVASPVSPVGSFTGPVLPGGPVAPLGAPLAGQPVGPVLGVPPSLSPDPVPALAPSAPLPTPYFPPACVEGMDTENITRTCPATQLGTWTQTREVVISCRDKENKYQAWNTAERLPQPWVDVVNTCAPACVSPANSSESQPASCPANQVLTSGASGFTQTRSLTYTCPAPTGAYTTSASPWTPDPSAVCFPKCVAPPADTRTSTPCPAGQTGVITEKRTYACPSPTGAAVGSPWSVVSNTCATPPPSGGCPAGQQRSRVGDLRYTNGWAAGNESSCGPMGSYPSDDWQWWNGVGEFGGTQSCDPLSPWGGAPANPDGSGWYLENATYVGCQTDSIAGTVDAYCHAGCVPIGSPSTVPGTATGWEFVNTSWRSDPVGAQKYSVAYTWSLNGASGSCSYVQGRVPTDQGNLTGGQCKLPPAADACKVGDTYSNTTKIPVGSYIYSGTTDFKCVSY